MSFFFKKKLSYKCPPNCFNHKKTPSPNYSWESMSVTKKKTKKKKEKKMIFPDPLEHEQIQFLNENNITAPMLGQGSRRHKSFSNHSGSLGHLPLTKTPHLDPKHQRRRWNSESSCPSRRHFTETGTGVLTVIVEVPAGLLDGVAVGRRVGRGRGWQVWGDAADGHGFPVPVHGLGVEGAELGVLRDSRAFEGIPVQVVPGVAGDARRVGDGAHGHLGRDVRVDVFVQFRVEVGSLHESRGWPQVLVSGVGLVLLLLLLPPDHLAAEHEHHHQQEDPDDEDNDADALGQPDVPRRRHVLVGRCVLAVPAPVLVAAVAVVGAVGVLAEGAVAAGVPRALVHVALTPARRAESEVRPSHGKPGCVGPAAARDQGLTQPLLNSRFHNRVKQIATTASPSTTVTTTRHLSWVITHLSLYFERTFGR